MQTEVRGVPLQDTFTVGLHIRRHGWHGVEDKMRLNAYIECAKQVQAGEQHGRWLIATDSEWAWHEALRISRSHGVKVTR